MFHWNIIVIHNTKVILDRLKLKDRDYIEKYNERLVELKSSDGTFHDKKLNELKKIFPIISSQSKWIKREYVLNNIIEFLKMTVSYQRYYTFILENNVI